MAPTLNPRLRKMLSELLAIPTASFQEAWLRGAIQKRFARAASVTSEVDQWGNLLLRYRPKNAKKKRAQFAFQAHLDHPGFCYRAADGKGKGVVETLGGMPPTLIGARLRFFPTAKGKGIPATIQSTKLVEGKRHLIVKHQKTIPDGCLGMWDFPSFKVKGAFIDGRGFDDNLGAALQVYLLEDAIRRRLQQPFDVLFTCAEEVGLISTTTMLRTKSLKLPATIITLEMPGARGELVPGDGVIIRTGDSMTVYDPDLVLHLTSLARDCAKAESAFRAQRRLGSGGGTEVSAFSLFGHKGMALCLPTVHGHNIAKDGTPTSERVHIGDLNALITLAQAFITTPLKPQKSAQALKKRLIARARDYQGRL